MHHDESYIRETVTDEKEREEIFSLLTECDGDFVPPLSQRASTYQQVWTQEQGASDGVTDYFNALVKQYVLLWKRNGETIGFISFVPHYACETVACVKDVCYLSTLCIRKACRGQGLAPRIYDAVVDYAHRTFPGEKIVLRTWSTNAAQLHMMEKLGFARIATLENDRGEGVDTIYFRKE